ncbi:transcriptional regulator [Listeria phage LIS04]|nr:transcriptional regulator [Listeria phage LIS04]
MNEEHSNNELCEFDQKIVSICSHLVRHRSTLRLTAYKYNVSSSTVRRYVTVHLERLDPELYGEAIKLLKLNSIDRGTPKG